VPVGLEVIDDRRTAPCASTAPTPVPRYGDHGSRTSRF